MEIPSNYSEKVFRLIYLNQCKGDKVGDQQHKYLLYFYLKVIFTVVLLLLSQSVCLCVFGVDFPH